jgi:hypothetical protein
MIGFSDTLHTQLGTRGNYSAIADLHTLQFAFTHAQVFSVFISRILATGFHSSLTLQITYEVFFSQPKSFLASILQLPIPKTRRHSVSLAPRLISRQAGVLKLILALYCYCQLRNYSLYSLGVGPTENTVFYRPILF